MCSALRQCSARGRACSAASDALRQQSSPQPCCSACAVSRAPQQCHCLCPVTETTRRQPAVAGAGERSPRASGESSASTRRRRRALFSASADGPRTADLAGSPQCPSGLGPHPAYAVERSRQRPTPSRLLVGPRRRNRDEPQVTLATQLAGCAHPQGLGHSSPSPRRRVAHVEPKAGQGPRAGFR